MPLKQKTWNKEQLRQMNEEAFLVDLLDMLKISPVIDSNDANVDAMKDKLAIVEAMIKDRLD
ncbi:hypothetical protein [Amphritea sp. HPY]|uniref:hypothetical protein n=1 Tax=Amphritea sp. HPY TaxID=3421652 RepID=UPI003D7DBF59